MAKIVVLPKLGYIQDEGQVVEWHKKVGDTVKRGEVLFDSMTDKCVVPVNSNYDGVLLKIMLEPDITVPVFTPIAVIGEPDEDPDAVLASVDGEKIKTEAEPQSEPQQLEISDHANSLKLTPKAKKLVKDEGYDVASLEGIKGTGFSGGLTAADIKASPLARKLAEKNNIELASVEGSGASGKIVRADVERAVIKNVASQSEDKIIASSVPYGGVRKIIGQRMCESKFTAPHLYFTDDVDTTAMSAFKKMLLDQGGLKVAVSDILVMAASKALQAYPEINSSLVDGRIITYESTNIGIAVAGDNGLIVPNIKNVQQKTLAQIATESRDLVARAKSGRLRHDEYNGGTFSISNLGMFGIKNFTAIINQPEAAILAVSAVRKTPVVITNAEGKDEIVIRPMMSIQLTVDHRIIDGLVATKFLEYYKQLLEEPIRLLL